MNFAKVSEKDKRKMKIAKWNRVSKAYPLESSCIADKDSIWLLL